MVEERCEFRGKSGIVLAPETPLLTKLLHRTQTARRGVNTGARSAGSVRRDPRTSAQGAVHAGEKRRSGSFNVN